MDVWCALFNQGLNAMLKKTIQLLLLCLLPGAVLASGSLTRDAVERMLVDVEQAAVNRDIDGIARYLAADFTAIFQGPVELGNSMKVNRQEYLQLTAEGWQMVSDYRFSQKIEDIELMPDGHSATVVLSVVESMTAANTTTTVYSDETVFVRLIGDTPKLVRLEGNFYQ